SAEAVQKGRSLFAGREGEVVGGELVRLIDDGRLPEGPSSAPFDDEGVATGRTLLVDGGVLRGFLHNTYTATRGKGRSTGNAARDAGSGGRSGVRPPVLRGRLGSSHRVDRGDDDRRELTAGPRSVARDAPQPPFSLHRRAHPKGRRRWRGRRRPGRTRAVVP